jgi:arsenite methyltransferase
MPTISRNLAMMSTLLLLTVTVAAQVPRQRHHPPESTKAYIKVLEDPGRQQWQKPDEVVKKLDLRPGEAIADIGAGAGYFTLRFARAVGLTGKVYAVDIDPGMLAYITGRAKQDHLENIRTVLAQPHDPELAPSSVDLIFICDTLHHISDRKEYFSLLARALKPGGRLVNIDFYKRSLPVGPPVEMKIAEPDMIDEAQSAGFHLTREFDFLPYQYFLVFAR